MDKKLELAWAAGLFDGEGTIGFYSGRGGHYIQLSIYQKNPSVLYRFDTATGDLGNIHKRRTREAWYYQCINSRARRVIEQILPYLDTVKLDQTIKALNEYKQYRSE